MLQAILRRRSFPTRMAEHSAAERYRIRTRNPHPVRKESVALPSDTRFPLHPSKNPQRHFSKYRERTRLSGRTQGYPASSRMVESVIRRYQL
jgi:hypothetical protein